MSIAVESPGLSETQRQIVELARDFARTKIAPLAAEWDRTKRFPRDVIAELGKLGFLGMCTPEEWDGMGVDGVTYLLALEEIAAADAAISVSMSIQNAIPTTMLVKHGTPVQKQRWLKPLARGELLVGFALSEPEAGSDPASMQAQAVRDGSGGGWVLNGLKAWATNGGTADLMMIMVRTDAPGSRRGAKGISTFIVPTDTPGYRAGKPEDKMGLRASNTATVALEDLHLPPEQLLGDEGMGFVYAMEGLDAGRLGIAIQAVGIARRALELSIAGGAVQAGGHGDAHRGGARARAFGGGAQGPRRVRRALRQHGQAVRFRDGDVGHDPGRPAVRRVRIHAGFPRRETVPRRQGHRAL